MKRIQKFAAVSILGALIGTGIPAMAAQNGYEGYGRGGMQYQSADHRGDRQWNDDRNREFRGEGRRDYDRRDYDRRDYDQHDYNWRERDRGYGYSSGNAFAPAYEPRPVYAGPVCGDRHSRY